MSEKEKLTKFKALLQKAKDKELKRIEEKYVKMGSINSIKDLIGDSEPSNLFFLQIRLFGYLLNNSPDKTISNWGVKLRRLIHPSVAKKSPEFLMNKQVIENRKFLLSEEIDSAKVEDDDPVILPDESVIWLQNHYFKDDALSSISAIPRHTYILFGSLPQFFNSIYGLSAQLGGVVMVNRKVKESKRASLDKTVKLFENGADILMCPEATWNKTPELLQLEYWSGIYEIAKKTGAKVVPIVHYISDPFDRDVKIHTVIDDPVDISKYSKDEAIEILRDKMSTWFYLMMEKYGRTTRDELLQGKTQDEAWKDYLERLMLEVDYYDTEVETTCDFRDRRIVRPEDVYENIANLELTRNNAEEVAHARALVRERKSRDYQRLY